MEQIIQEIQSLEERISNLHSQLREHRDGFFYLTCLRCYGSVTYETYNNTFFVQKLCDGYNGDNGIVDVYTNNPSHSICNWSGDVIVMTLEEIQNISQDSINMSHAITNWIAGI
jgi:hypothetical protein